MPCILERSMSLPLAREKMFAFYFVDAIKLDDHRGVLAHRPSPLLRQQSA
jgi:hypothetical protein